MGMFLWILTLRSPQCPPKYYSVWCGQAKHHTSCIQSSAYLRYLIRLLVLSGGDVDTTNIFKVSSSTSVWPQARHLHASAACKNNPRCLVIFSRATKWFIYLLATCRSGKRMRTVKGAKMRWTRWKLRERVGISKSKGDENQTIGGGNEQTSAETMITAGRWEGAGGRTRSGVIYRLTQSMKGRVAGGSGKWKRHDWDSIKLSCLVRHPQSGDFIWLK